MFRRLDDPDEGDAPRRDGAVGEAGYEGAHVGHLVRDADAAGKEHDGAVAVERVQAAVGPLGKGADNDGAVLAGLGLFPYLVGKAIATADDA